MKLVAEYQIPVINSCLENLVGFYTHLTYICICSFFVTFFSATIDGRNLIFGHKLYIGMSYCGKRFWTRQIPTFPGSGGIINIVQYDKFQYGIIQIIKGIRKQV
jgi:hypothetical protein